MDDRRASLALTYGPFPSFYFKCYIREITQNTSMNLFFGQLRVIWSPNFKNRKKLRKYRKSAITSLGISRFSNFFLIYDVKSSTLLNKRKNLPALPSNAKEHFFGAKKTILNVILQKLPKIRLGTYFWREKTYFKCYITKITQNTFRNIFMVN